MIENDNSMVYGLVCLGLLVLWVWSLVLSIQICRKLKKIIAWWELARPLMEDKLTGTRQAR